MKLKNRQTINFFLVPVILVIMGLVMFYTPGISVQNGTEQAQKIPGKLEKVVPSDARITSLHLDGFGASRKFRYAIVTYLLPDEGQSYTASLYLDGTGGSFTPQARDLLEDESYEDGMLLKEMDFSQIATNVRRIRDRFVKENKQWMGIAEYSIRLDTKTGDFVHETQAWYEMGSAGFKMAVSTVFKVTPGESVTFLISENGTGPLEIKE